MLKLTNKVTYVGKIDLQLRKFHGEQLTTNRGSSYNSYLLQDEKNILIDTVFSPFANEFIDDLEKIINLEKIDAIIALHAEPDHSGALPKLLELIPNVPIYCTANGISSLKGYFHKDWNFLPVKTGDKISIGSSNLTFVEAQMLHWPDQLMCHLDSDGILFSSDVFGQHFANELMFDNKVDTNDLLAETIKYYANIVAPYDSRVLQKLNELAKLALPIKMIAPSHGIIWKENSQLILEKYANWANAYKENQITIIYDSMYGSTKKMAESLAEGIKSVDTKVVVKLFNSATADSSEIITEAFISKGILVGSPTYNAGLLNSVAAFLQELKGMRLKDKKAAAFGSYGWAAFSVKIISNLLKDAGFVVPEAPGVTVNWNPCEKDLAVCKDFGQKFAEFCR